MKIKFLLLKISLIYILKMAANGGRHFEINTETQNYKSQFIEQKQAYSYSFDKCDLCLLCKYTFYGLFHENCVFGRIYWPKINIHYGLVTSQPY